MSEPVSGRRIVVVGGARSGMAAAQLLASRGADVTLADVRVDLPEAGRLGDQGIRVELGPHEARTFERADLIVLSPGVPLRQPALDRARRARVPIIGEVELASRLLQGRIIAITGTKGKSTTTTLVGRMLEAAGLRVAVAGNIGAPLSAEVDRSTADTIHVVEVSSFQLETTSTFHPWISVLLNLSADHLDRHANLHEYAAAKARVFANQGEGDWAVINADDPAAMTLAGKHARAPRRWFSLDKVLDEGMVLADGWLVERDGGEE
ncbi:MAG: UDP-N-acetylmuramoyl-L-alanine--D-glutamate ligase, partial [Acidobacteria bacterium]